MLRISCPPETGERQKYLFFSDNRRKKPVPVATANVFNVKNRISACPKSEIHAVFGYHAKKE
jgi:hypothetical protein